MITILVGKSASGKDTILNELVNRFGYEPLVSVTTRPMREGEVNGREYNFISVKDFAKLIEEKRLVEHRSYNTLYNGEPDVWYYGSEAIDLDPKKNYVKILDVEGANKFIEQYGRKNLFIVSVMATKETREFRAVKRGGFSKEEWDRRLVDDEIKFAEDKVGRIKNYTIYNDYDLDKEGLVKGIAYLVKAREKYEDKIREAKSQKDYQYNCTYVEDYETGSVGLFIVSKEELDEMYKTYIDKAVDEREKKRKKSREYEPLS